VVLKLPSTDGPEPSPTTLDTDQPGSDDAIPAGATGGAPTAIPVGGGGGASAPVAVAAGARPPPPPPLCRGDPAARSNN